MPFQVIEDPKTLGETPTKSRGAAMKEIKNLSSGAARGYIGEVPPSMMDDDRPVTEKLTDEEKEFKVKLRSFLAANVNPPTLSTKVPPGKGLQILNKKLSKMTLGELRRFWSKKTVPESATDEEKANIQNIWDDVSP